MTDHITIPRALLEQALEALESCDPGDWSTGHVIPASYNERAVEDAINDIRAELAKPTTAQHDAPDVSKRKPMTNAEKDVLWQKANAERNRLSRQSFLDGVESAEAFHGIKEGGAA